MSQLSAAVALQRPAASLAADSCCGFRRQVSASVGQQISRQKV